MDELGTRLAESLTDILKDRCSKEQTIEKRLEAFEKECKEIGIENKLLRESLDKQNVRHGLLQEEVEKLMNHNKVLQDSIDRQNVEHMLLREEVGRLTSHNEALLEKIEKTNSAQKTLRDDLNKTALDTKTLRETLSVLQEKFTTETDKLHLDLDRINNEGKNLREKFEKHLEDLQQKITKCEQWNTVISVMASQVRSLKEEKEDIKDWREGLDDHIGTMDNNLRQLTRQQQQIILQQQQQQQQIQHQQLLIQNQLPQQQSNLGSYRMPARSPSASSFLNGSYRRSATKTSGYESLDPADDISELSAGMENFKREVDGLNELNKSFERSSMILND